MATQKVQIQRDQIVHVNAYCRDCSLLFQDMRTARKDAFAHAKKTGHRVDGETGYAWAYNYHKSK
jgi:hypothetical protein